MRIGSLSVLLASAAFASLTAHAEPRNAANAVFHDRQGVQNGSATLTQTPHGVLIKIELTGLPDGEHAFHIHEKGQCDPASGFKSAGGHFAPAHKQHGYLADKGHHAGDMPNQFIASGGKLRAEVFNSNVELASSSLLDADGSSLVVHAKADDYHSQPAGDAGDRIACGVIKLH